MSLLNHSFFGCPFVCSRRAVLAAAVAGTAKWMFAGPSFRKQEEGNSNDKKDLQPVIKNGLDWLAGQQTRLGHWNDATYPTAVTSLAGLALISSGSTATQGPYATNIRDAVDYLISRCRANGLIGNPMRDNRYTYGHGFAMLFLSQVLGEEEDAQRRDELTAVLQKAVEFSVAAQTKSGGWGYVSSTENSTFDEGSTTITQVQGLRG